ncbi:hypothetical protein CRG98_032436 [Punica granatum]|uniref:Uncharacterized protein n=1 Tax=Punica granatum TaxID=22663 RepID=A0A2I0IT29_PUNGR|nr:hypothetical protein CRG98_032436 [Punica granatum]
MPGAHDVFTSSNSQLADSLNDTQLPDPECPELTTSSPHRTLSSPILSMAHSSPIPKALNSDSWGTLGGTARSLSSADRILLIAPSLPDLTDQSTPHPIRLQLTQSRLTPLPQSRATVAVAPPFPYLLKQSRVPLRLRLEAAADDPLRALRPVSAIVGTIFEATRPFRHPRCS